jgi:hypothetical protein
MLSLSGGWQMRSPFEVRRRELTAALLGKPEAADRVFTLEPGAAFIDPPGRRVDSSGAPAPLQQIHQRLVAISALYETLADPVAIPAVEGKELRASGQALITSSPGACERTAFAASGSAASQPRASS